MQARSKRIFVIGFLFMVVMASFIFYSNQRILDVGSSYILSADEVPQSEAILVLGAYVSPDGKTSQMLDKRLQVGYDLYKKGKASKIIVSGDHGRKDYDEVNVMKKFFMDKDVPPEAVFMDHAGFTTYDSMYRARTIFKVNKMIVVTQEFHLPRTIFIARELGVEAWGVVAGNGNYSDLVMLKNYLRETIARSKAFIATLIKPYPTFLGETIPVTGDGRITDDKPPK
ncbi:MAG: putative rane protein [Firmicutes bacterium]|nr:putative rane protein [Bacillota bacterium]